MENEDDLNVIYDSLYNFIYPELSVEEFERIIKNKVFLIILK